MTERLDWIKETLICAVEGQLGDITDVDAKELGEVIDMIKDIEEAIYYCTVTEAMEGKGYSGWEPKHETHHSETSKTHMEPEEWDQREGKSHKNRKMYMEAKETHQDKVTQMRELEKYMQELSQEIVDMINDASTEEKQYLEKKLTTLATKVSQLK